MIARTLRSVLPLSLNRPRNVLAALTVTLALGISLSSCTQLRRASAKTTEIAELTQTVPNAEVYIRGTVTNQFSALGRGAYQVEDSSGSIWVTSERGLPPVNSTIVVKGLPRHGITIGPRAFGTTLAEIERF